MREEANHISLRLKANYGRSVKSSACHVFACDETRFTACLRDTKKGSRQTVNSADAQYCTEKEWLWRMAKGAILA